MANASTPLIPADGTITITDGSGTPKTVTVAYEDGDYSVSGLNGNAQQDVQVFSDRGRHASVRKVSDQPIDFTFTCHALGIIGDGTTALIGDAVLKKGAWSAATSTLPTANGDAYLLQVAWTGERSNFGASADSGLTLKYCALSVDFAEGVPGKMTVKGTAYIISTDYMTVT